MGWTVNATFVIEPENDCANEDTISEYNLLEHTIWKMNNADTRHSSVLTAFWFNFQLFDYCT